MGGAVGLQVVVVLDLIGGLPRVGGLLAHCKTEAKTLQAQLQRCRAEFATY